MAWRYLIAAPVVIGLAGWGTVRRVPPPQALALVVLGGAGQFAVTYLSLSALAWLPAAAVGFLFYTYPAWVAVFSALAGLERLTVMRVAALAIALVGITLMVGAPWAMELPFRGVWRALAGAVVFAVFIPLMHRLRGDLSAAAASAYIFAGAAVAFSALASSEGGLLAPMSLPSWAVALWLALVCTIVAFMAFLKGLAVVGPVRAAILSTTEPFWTAVFGLLVLGQPLGPATLLGGGCIVLAILILQRPVAPRPAPLPN